MLQLPRVGVEAPRLFKTEPLQIVLLLLLLLLFCCVVVVLFLWCVLCLVSCDVVCVCGEVCGVTR